MVTVSVVAMLLVLLGVAVDYSGQISRNTQRTRKTAAAMEIADGHLEALFSNWRNVYRTTWTTTAWTQSGGTDYSLVGTNYFYTTCASCSPAMSYSPAPTPMPSMSPSPGATPPRITLPDPTLFPSEPNYTVTQYRIQAVDPMITLDSSENALVEGNSSAKGTGGYVALSKDSIPPAAFGPNAAFGLAGGFPYSLYYLAAVDVQVPALKGNVTAKVRRVFEKKFDLPWAYGLFYVDDLELQPSTPMTFTGAIHTNGTLYIGTSNFTVANPTYASPTPIPSSGRVEYGADYVNGFSPKDPSYGSTVSAPTFAKSSSSLSISDCPPSQVSPYLPFGWNLSLTSGGCGNDDGYHEIIERPVGTCTDLLKYVRYYGQPGYQVLIAANTTANGNGAYTVTRVAPYSSATPNPTPQAVTGNPLTTLVGNNGNGTSTTVFNQGRGLIDAREGGAVKVTDVDIANLVSNLSSLTGWTGVLYLSDAGATIYNADRSVKTAGTAANVTINGVTYSTTKRAFRLINAYALPSGGLTVVSENPVYIQGNYNTSASVSALPPSNSGTYTDPDNGSYARQPAAVIADAITVLSNGWSDNASANGSANQRPASANITINAALVSGNVPSDGSHYSGGGEHFIRLLEDWSARTFCYYGSMVQLYRSNQAIGYYSSGTSVFTAPGTEKYFHDYPTFADGNPPGNLQIAAYLQQQRWYQVY